MLTTTNTLPVYLVIDEDARWLGKYSFEEQPTHRSAIARARLD